MNPQQARARVAETFPKAFNREKFLEFSRNLLNKFDESKAYAGNTTYIKDAFKPHVARFERLGTYTTADDEKLDVLVVHLTNESKLERARTAIRNFVADQLKTRDEKDAALVAFVSPNDQQWRFSYVKMEYAAVETESGKVGVETRLTPARRYSYIVGEGESCHTAQTRFLALLQDTENYPTLAQLEEAFSVDAVTKEFFNQYAALFDAIDAALQNLAAKDKTIHNEFKKNNVSTVDFAKKLMGQIVFLYFMQKKGWLGVDKGKDWGTGPRDFLRRLADGEYGAYKNFFNDILEPLFYDTLATDRGHEAWCKTFKCRIPFLNGGLFEPLGDYDWRKTDITLPNKFFTNTECNNDGDIGTGVLDVFDRHNFTVNEAEPLEKEVAIDPEMLGKVFENLIEDNRRKGLGSFYTPREIVHYMCQESLISYLDSSINTPQESVPRSDLEIFVYIGDQISHYEAVDARYVGRAMPKQIKEHAKIIDEKLSGISVCDPAVGSGAFPVGMMTEIVRARSALTPYFNDVHDRTPYHFKRHAIQNCLYGVDIDPGAVEIAKLRLWLSLVVDEEDLKQIKPLPNLDYKIVIGNSLFGVEKDLFNNEQFKKLEALKPKFFDESNRTKKVEYKCRIEGLIHELTNGRELFDFEIYFSEVFHSKRGFDICIANPPYGANIDSQLALLARLYPETTKEYKDIYKVFIELGLAKLTTKGGTLCYIVPNTLLLQPRYKDVRQFLLKHSLVEVVNLGEEVFETVVVPTCVIIARHGAKTTSSVKMRNVAKNSKFAGDLRAVAPVAAKQATFQGAPDFVFTDKLRTKKSNEVELAEIMDLKDCGIKYQRTNVGLAKKGGNDLWERLFYTGRKQHPNDVHYITGSELNRSGWRIDFSKDQYFRHNYRSLLRANEIVYFNKDVFDLPAKIVWRQTSSYFVGAFLGEGVWFGNTLQAGVLKSHYVKKIDLYYLLALLNSTYLRHLYINIVQEMGRVFPQVKLSKLKGLPIKNIALDQQGPFAKLVKQIIVIAKDGDYLDNQCAQEKVNALAIDIDRLVYTLYDVTTKDIKAAEASAKSTGRAKR